MAAASTLAALAFLYKRRYTDRKVQNLATRMHPFYNRLTKQGDFTGDSLSVAIRTGNNQGVSTQFTNAKNNAKPLTGKTWLIPQTSLTKIYGFVTIDWQAMEAAGNDEGSFLRVRAQEMDSNLEEIGRRTAKMMYGDGAADIGRRASLAGNVVTLETASDAYMFQVGMTINASATRTGGAIRAGSTYVTAVDEENGKITLNDASAITSFSDNDYLYPDGDYDQGIKGLAKYIPTSAPTAGDSLWGVDRSYDTRRLAGTRMDGTGVAEEEAILDLSTRIWQTGGSTAAAFCNPTRYTNVVKKLGSKVVREQGAGAEIGFPSVTVLGASGTFELYSDPDCPLTDCYLLDMSTWYFKTLKPWPHIVMDDGLQALRGSDFDGIEIRTRGAGQLICDAPGKNGRIYNFGS